MVLADALSRLPDLENPLKVLKDVTVHGFEVIDAEAENFINKSLINFPPDKQSSLKQETTNDFSYSHWWV